MRSASRHSARLGALAACAALLAGGAMGCATTQEKAAQAQTHADRVLDARAKRQQQKKKTKQNQQKGKGTSDE